MNGLLFLLTFALFCATGRDVFVQGNVGAKTLPPCTFTQKPLTEIKLFEQDNKVLFTISLVLIIKSKTNEGCILQMNQIVSPPAKQQLLIYYFFCVKSHPIFFNTENVTSSKDNIVYFQLAKCIVNEEEMSKIDSLYDLKVLTYFRQLPTIENWKVDNSMRNNYSSIRDVVSFTIESNKRSQRLPWIFEVNETFPSIAELSFTKCELTKLPSDMQSRFPNLQAIELNSNRLTDVPTFPYTENLSYLPFNLRRTANMQNHYATSIGINIPSNVFRRILFLNNNFIKYLPDYFSRGTLQSISINSNGLSNISDFAFHGIMGLQSLFLKNNSIVSINDKVFRNSSELRLLDLAENIISSIHTGTFLNLSKLTKLDLSRNNLTTFEPGTFYPLTSLRTLELSHNKIEKFDSTVLHTGSIKLKEVNLSRNQFKSLPVIFFLIRSLEIVDLSHCQINIGPMSVVLDLIPESDFIDSIVSSASSPVEDMFLDREKKRIINLENNLIRRLNFSGFSDIHSKKMILILKNYELILSGNPIECDCHLVDLIDFFDKARSKYFKGNEYFYHKWQCHSPSEFQGRPLLSLKKDDLFCREEMSGCPTGCTCYRRYVSSVVIVNCTSGNFISFPTEMPVGKLEIWLQHNNISQLEERNYLSQIVILKMTKNLIRNLSVSVFKQMKGIKELYLDANLLTTLPEEVQEISFELLSIDMNHIVCDCHNRWMKKWLMNSATRIPKWHKIKCTTSEDKVVSIIQLSDEEFVCVETANFKKTLALGLSLGFAILLVLIILFLLFYYRLEVKVLIYIYLNLHPFDCDLQKADDEKEPIDTVVICSKSMIEWVAANITNPLESLRFNVLDINRDFLIGMSIRENLRMAVCRSKRSIVILSTDSFSDPVIHLALTFTHEKVLRERPTYMVLFLHNVKERIRDNQDLKKYLSSGRYIRTCDNMLKQKMLYMLTGSNETDSQNIELRRKKSYGIFFPEIMDSSLPGSNISYDIFISYPDCDYQFATSVLFPALNDRGYCVCLPDRDFMVGTAKEENILNAIEQSRQTLVIVTENHVDDEWQLYTLRTAIERSLKETFNYLLCVLDPKVDLGALDPETRAFVSTHAVICQDDPLFWQKLYRSLPQPSFKKEEDSEKQVHQNGPSKYFDSNTTNKDQSLFSNTDQPQLV